MTEPSDPAVDRQEPPAEDALRVLHPNVRKAWVLSGMLTTLVLSSGSGVAEFLWLARQGWYPLPGFVATGIVFAVLLAISFGMPRLWYRAWRYQVREHDVILWHGVLWTVCQSVPRLRIQHVDINRDPIDRMLGLASVTLYTAGSGGEDATIPGLTPDEAETLREELLVRPDAEGQADAEADAPPDEEPPPPPAPAAPGHD